jgi:tetratricopeptide (TPR) repeat protein
LSVFVFANNFDYERIPIVPPYSRSGFLTIGFLAFTLAASLLGGALPQPAEKLLAATIASLKDPAGPEAVVLWNEMGRLRQTRSETDSAKTDPAEMDSAEQAFRRAFELNQHLANPSKLETAVVLNNLGTIALARRDYPGAETLFRQGYKLLDENRLLGTQTAGSLLTNLALDLQQQTRYTEAKPFYELAFAAFRASDNETSLEFVKLLTNSGELSFELGDFAGAVRKQRRAVALEEALPSIANGHRAYTLNRLALALTRTEALEEARTMFQKALELANGDSLSSTRQRIEALNNLSGADRHSGHLAAAAQRANEALRLASLELGPDEPVWAALWNNLGMIALAANDLGAAKEYYEKSAAFSLRISGRESPRYAAALSNLATLEARQGHHKRAQALWITALTVNETRLGPKHPQVASDLANLASESFYAKKYEQAIDLYQRAAAIQEQSLGAQSRQTAATWRNLAIVYHGAKRYRDAQAAYQRAIDAFEASAGAGSLDLLDCLKRDADVLRKLERFAEAEQAEVRATRIEVRNAIRAETES